MKPIALGVASLVISTAFASFCFAQDKGAKHTLNTNKAGSCIFSGGVVDNCILHHQDGTMFVSPGVLKQLEFDSLGLAPVRVEEDRGLEPMHILENPHYLWMYVNRRGRVVISGVPSFDNWADEFSGGLVRTVVDGKYGFANRQGRIVIKPAYDWASPFDHGSAHACNHCREMCAMPGGAVELQSVPGGCDHRIMVGGEWFKIDKKGRIVARRNDLLRLWQ